MRALRLFGDALGAARTSGNARLELETAMLRFILQTEDPTLDALAARVDRARRRNPGPGRRPRPPSPPAAPAPAAPPAPSAGPEGRARRRRPQPRPTAARRRRRSRRSAALTPAKVRSLWSNVRARAESEKPSLAASLGRATIDAVTDDAITLRIPDPIAGETLKRSLDTLRRAVDAVIGRPIELRVLAGAAPVTSDPAPDDELNEEHPDDVARYAFDRLL